MDYIYKYEDSMRQCETLLTENIVKLCNYSICLLSSSISSFESTERVKEYEILKKKLDTAQENIATLKSEYNDLTLHCTKSTSFGINFKETYFNYLGCQETLRLKFIETISECKHISLRLDDILHDSSNQALNESSNQNTSKRGRSITADGFDLSSIPKVYVVLPKLDWGYGDPLISDSHRLKSNSFSNEHTEELSTSTAASVSKSLEVSSSDLNSDVTVKKCNSTTVLETKKLKNWASSKRNEAPTDLSQSLVCQISHRSISDKAKENMKKYMFLHRGLKLFECADCSKSFVQKINLKSHIFSLHMPYQSRPYKCDICSKFYSTRSNLKYHRCSTSVIPKKVSDLSQSLVCKICHKNICNKRQMRRHMFLHKGLKLFECADCGKSFTRKENIKSHIFSMHMPHSSRPYKCDICSKFYSTLSNLKYHRCSTSAIPKKVSDCTRKENKLIETRIGKEVSDRHQSSACKICHKHFNRPYYLKLHMLIHKGLKPFKCAECGKSFRCKYEMNRHINECHTPYHTRRYKCDICSQRYAAQYRLNAHKRLAGHYCSSKLFKVSSVDVNDGVTIKEHDSTTVLGAKKVRKLVSSKQKKNSNSSQFFVCNVCHRNFSRRYNLKRHLMSHKALKPFKCAECDKSFSTKFCVRSHIVLMHINDQRSLSLDSHYYCAHCKYRCRIKENLLRHIKKDHTSNLCLEEFSCSICSKTFSNSVYRRRHEQRVHVKKNVSVE